MRFFYSVKNFVIAIWPNPYEEFIFSFFQSGVLNKMFQGISNHLDKKKKIKQYKFIIYKSKIWSKFVKTGIELKLFFWHRDQNIIFKLTSIRLILRRIWSAIKELWAVGRDKGLSSCLTTPMSVAMLIKFDHKHGPLLVGNQEPESASGELHSFW